MPKSSSDNKLKRAISSPLEVVKVRIEICSYRFFPLYPN
ncbi:hypothetical protein NEOC95_001441 [Neochlamydia sp. AcF95]|nr:hypothetical protein [Neochlamydia sp. AcF95]